jgi:VWFA-related protein
VSISRVSLGVLLGVVSVGPLGIPGLAQTSPAQSAQPTFRSTLDLLTLDTSVRDKSGLPVPDLQASDFTVTIDGRPRRVVSSVFFQADATPGGRLTGGATPTPQHVSNEGSVPGRVVLFVVDTGSIRGGQERALLNTASRMLDGLSAADAVGLAELPVGSAIEATRNHSAVAEALQRIWGRAPSGVERLAAGRTAAARKLTERARGAGMLAQLAGLVRQMAVVRAPRSVILISGGFDFGFELLAQYRELQRAAAESRVVLYTVLLEEIGYEASLSGEFRPDIAENPARTEGLATIASATGGMFFNAAGQAGGIFDRIQSEVTSFYQLAIESSPADADGKPRDVKVRVNRTGVDVRAPALVAVPKPSKAASRDPLIAALLQPTDVSDVPIAATTYSTHGVGGAIHLRVAAEVGAPNAAPPVEWGLVVLKNGKDVAIRRGRFPAGSERPRVVSTSVEVPPGNYRLRVASLDTEDRIGVVEVPFTASYETADTTKLSDLIVGVAAAGELEPRRTIARSEELTAMLEVLAGPGVVLGGRLQLVPAGSARSALSVPFSIRPAGSDRLPATWQARASLATVPPGRYTASAVLEIGGQPLTRISRIIEVTAPASVKIP